MSEVFFSADDGKAPARLREEIEREFAGCKIIAIKLHMGESYNPNHLQPAFVRKFAGLLKSMGMKPFLFDSPTMYGGPRHTELGYLAQAASLGFSEEGVGCPVVVSDDFVEEDGENMKYQVCRRLAEADGVLVLSHFKGHVCSAMGGCIKNIGMGALTIKSKKDIHEGAMPVSEGACALCRKCLDVCPQKCVDYSEGGPVFNYSKCYGCSKCIQNCPQKYLKPKVADFDTLLADGAAAALRRFRKAYFLNVLRRITNVCDCSSKDLKIICPDIGVVMGRDACAVDMAAIDLGRKKAGRDVFLETWHKDPSLHVKEAERLGMGSTEYHLQDA